MVVIKKRNAAPAVGLVVAALSLSYGSAVSAAQVLLNYSWTYNGASIVNTGFPSTNNNTATNVPVVGSSYYGNTFTSQLTNMIPGSNYGLNRDVPNGGSNSSDGSQFYDDYIFTITAATTNSITSTINLGTQLVVTDMSARLYQLPASPAFPYIGPSNNPVPSGYLIEGWAAPIGAIGEYTMLAPINLTAGTYVLEVRGNVVGTSGGSYSGTINFAEVIPVPAAAWLFGSALGLLGLRRRIK